LGCDEDSLSSFVSRFYCSERELGEGKVGQGIEQRLFDFSLNEMKVQVFIESSTLYAFVDESLEEAVQPESDIAALVHASDFIFIQYDGSSGEKIKNWTMFLKENKMGGFILVEDSTNDSFDAKVCIFTKLFRT
jgi:hypothetical protein